MSPAAFSSQNEPLSSPAEATTFRFCVHPAKRAGPFNELAEFEELALRLPTFYTDACDEAHTRFKQELLAAAEAVAARAGGIDNVAVGLSEPQRQRAFVFLSFLVHFYVWCEDGATETTVPRVVAVPYYRVANQLGCPPVYSDAVIMWNMVAPVDGSEAQAVSCDPADIHLEFSWTGTQSERWFSVVQGAILRLLDPMMERALYLRETVLPRAEELRAGGARGPAEAEEGHQLHETIVEYLNDLDATLVQARMVMGRMFERLDPHDFLVFRRFFEGWKSASEYSRAHLPNGLTFAGVERAADGTLSSVTLSGVPGANAGQQGSWHVIDSLLGISHNEDFLREQREFMPAAHRHFVERFVVSADPSSSSLQAYFDARPELGRGPYTRAVASLRAYPSRGSNPVQAGPSVLLASPAHSWWRYGAAGGGGSTSPSPQCT